MNISVKQARKYRHFVFDFEYDKEKVYALKKIAGVKFNPNKNNWSAPIGQESSLVLRKLIESGIAESVTDEVIQTIESYKTKEDFFASASSAKSASRDFVIPDLVSTDGKRLYPFQKAGVEYMIKSKRCINADDMGLGKTAQVIAAAWTAGVYPMLVICPSVVVKKWKREFNEWTPRVKVQMLVGNLIDTSAHVYVMNYEQLGKYKKNLMSMKFEGIVVDESHRTKNKKSIRFENVYDIAKDKQFIFLLSGTIIENKPEDLIPQLKILDRLSDFGGVTSFLKKYCDMKFTEYGMKTDGAKNLKLLNERLRAICMVRRTKKDVAKELKGKSIPQVIKMDITTRDEYSEAERNPVKWLFEKNKNKRTNLAVSDLFDGTKDENVAPERDEMILEFINALKYVSAMGKLKSIYAWIEEMAKRKKSEKFVIFSGIIDVQYALKKHFGCLSILGEDSNDRRDTVNLMFEKNHAPTNIRDRIIVCSLKAANFGINLVSANNVIFTDFDWTSTIHDQAEDRCNRLGQQKFTNCYYAIGKDSIDEDLFALIQKKKNIVSQVHDGVEIEEENYSVLDELKTIIATRYNI